MIVTHIQKTRATRAAPSRVFWPAIIGAMAVISAVGGTLLAMHA
jgi:hypothetical protein